MIKTIKGSNGLNRTLSPARLIRTKLNSPFLSQKLLRKLKHFPGRMGPRTKLTPKIFFVSRPTRDVWNCHSGEPDIPSRTSKFVSKCIGKCWYLIKLTKVLVGGIRMEVKRVTPQSRRTKTRTGFLPSRFKTKMQNM